uniref:Uncharacterized protein n=1 Tax=Octopus bimaculoides TaxID=37653 RepID=A0A0L8I9M6_OCTBM
MINSENIFQISLIIYSLFPTIDFLINSNNVEYPNSCFIGSVYINTEMTLKVFRLNNSIHRVK